MVNILLREFLATAALKVVIIISNPFVTEKTRLKQWRRAALPTVCAERECASMGIHRFVLRACHAPPEGCSSGGKFDRLLPPPEAVPIPIHKKKYSVLPLTTHSFSVGAVVRLVSRRSTNGSPFRRPRTTWNRQRQRRRKAFRPGRPPARSRSSTLKPLGDYRWSVHGWHCLSQSARAVESTSYEYTVRFLNHPVFEPALYP